ncbi:MAG: hypothetical protein ABI622_04870 [Chloroflexota bacterium]
MTGSKRPSTSSLRRFITSRPYVPIAELRRRFGLDEPDDVCRVERPGQAVYLGLPEREATKIADLWARDEIGLELSVEVRAPVVVGIYPMRIARFVTDSGFVHGTPVGNGAGHPPMNGLANGHVNGHVSHSLPPDGTPRPRLDPAAPPPSPSR